MVKITDLKTAGQVEEEARADPEVRRELDRTALANAVAMRVIDYRVRHGLSQTQLARQLGMHQSAIARLEAGDHEPSLPTLARLARQLGIGFDILITPEAVETVAFDEVSGSGAADAVAPDLADAIPDIRPDDPPGVRAIFDNPDLPVSVLNGVAVAARRLMERNLRSRRGA
jgi:transcriptional regulator with XRE-family HTH domain